MLTKRLDSLEDKMIDKNTVDHLQHYHSNNVGVCNGNIFNVNCPVVHLKSPINAEAVTSTQIYVDENGENGFLEAYYYKDVCKSDTFLIVHLREVRDGETLE